MTRPCREPPAKKPRDGDVAAEEFGTSEDLVVVEVRMSGLRLRWLLLLLRGCALVVAPHPHVSLALFLVKDGMWPFAGFCHQMLQDLDHPQWEVSTHAHTHAHMHTHHGVVCPLAILSVHTYMLHDYLSNEIRCTSHLTNPSRKGDTSVYPVLAFTTQYNGGQ